jgi:hypothetical protein
MRKVMKLYTYHQRIYKTNWLGLMIIVIREKISLFQRQYDEKLKPIWIRVLAYRFRMWLNYYAIRKWLDAVDENKKLKGV